ncbi:MAG: GNAT family N-acetyltransferase [Angelakisella sp.]
MPRPGKGSALPEEIFLRCFGEEAAPEMEYIFSRCGDALWKAERDGIPAAMLVAMPVTIALPEGEWKARYFYGVATHPDYRKQGLCGGLLTACCRWMSEQGKPPHCCGRIVKRTGNSTGKMALPIAAPWGWGNLPRGRRDPALRPGGTGTV